MLFYVNSIECMPAVYEVSKTVYAPASKPSIQSSCGERTMPPAEPLNSYLSVSEMTFHIGCIPGRREPGCQTFRRRYSYLVQVARGQSVLHEKGGPGDYSLNSKALTLLNYGISYSDTIGTDLRKAAALNWPFRSSKSSIIEEVTAQCYLAKTG